MEGKTVAEWELEADEYTIHHLKAWIHTTIVPENQDRVLSELTHYLAKDNNSELMVDHSWSEIMHIAGINF